MKIASTPAPSNYGSAQSSRAAFRWAVLGLLLTMGVFGCGGDTGHGPIFISDATPDNSVVGAEGGAAGGGNTGATDGGRDASDTSVDTSSINDVSRETSTGDAPLTSDAPTDNKTDAIAPNESSVADAVDANRPDVAIDATSTDARGSDVSEAGLPDVSVDTSPPDAPSGEDIIRDVGKPDRNWGSCDPLVSPQVCSDCELGACPRDPTGCSTTGCSLQPWCDDYPAPADQALCKAVLSCIRLTNCISRGTVDCFCGGTDIVACKADVANALGECKDEILAGFAPLTKSAAIVDALGEVKYPGGGAMSLGNCDYAYCGSKAIGGNEECVPFCKPTPDGGNADGAPADAFDGSQD